MKLRQTLLRTAAAWVLCVAGAGTALAQPRQAAPPPAAAAANPAGGAVQVVPLPHLLRDDSGLSWNVNVDGSVTDGNNEFLDSGGQLFVGPNSPYAPPIQQTTFDPAHNELLFPPQSAMGLSVSRRVMVDARGGWCRFVEVLENPGANPIRTQVKLRFDLSLGVQATEPVGDERRGGQPRGLAVSDGAHGIAMVAAARGSRLAPQVTPVQGGQSIEFAYDVEVPPRKTLALAHVHARRATLQDAAAFVRKSKERDWLRGLPAQLVARIANFPTADRIAGGVDVLRGDVLDVVELRGGDLYKGTLKEQAYKLRTPYGPVELPAESVAAMVTLGEFRPAQLLVTTDGQVFGGTLEAEGGALRLELSSGQVTSVPVNTVRRFGYRLRAGEGDEDQVGENAGAGPAQAAAGQVAATRPAAGRPLVILRTGDRLAVDVRAAPIPVATCYGQLRLDPRTVASLSFQSEEHEHGVHEVRLTDGSRFAGVVAQEKFEFNLVGVGAGTGVATGGAATGEAAGRKASSGGRVVSFAATSISRLQLAREPEERGSDAATLALGNGDVLVGGLAGKLVLETAFDAIEVNAEELRALRPGGVGAEGGGGGGGGGAQPAPAPTEVQLTLWDGATLSGRLRADALDCKLGCGAAVKVPVALVKEYAQPQPRPPAQAVQRIKAVVAELNADDWKARDRAAAHLAALGPGSAGVLRTLRDGQPPEVRQRIDQILASFDAAPGAGTARAVAPQPAAGPANVAEPNPPADVEVEVVRPARR